jgi:hypothetical protein
VPGCFWGGVSEVVIGRPAEVFVRPVTMAEGRQVLGACGHMLQRIHAIDPARVLGGDQGEPGRVLVHGDYGPNNLLLDTAAPQSSR